MGYCERPFARVSPPVWRAQGGTASAQTTLFARSPCVRLSCVPALVGVSPALLHAGVLPHCFALTLPCLPTRCGVGAKVFARVGLYLLWACLLAGGWGLVFALLPVFVWVFACLLVCACLGWWDNYCPAAPAPLAWLVLTLWCGLEKRVREPVGGQVRGGNGAGHDCPAPCAAGWRCRRCVRVEERRLRVGVPARSGEHNPTPSLVLAYMETGSHPVGAKQRGGATGRAWWPGWGRGAFLVRAP